METLILNVTGSDRPGLTQALAAAVLGAGGNWLESHLSQLGGLYVGSVLVEVEAEGVERLRAAVKAVDSQGLEVRIAPAIAVAAPAGPAIQFSLVGHDRPGIVHQVTALLSDLGANIEALDTRLSLEAQTGAPLFHMEARLSLPAGLASDEVQVALEAISGEIMVDVAVQPALA
ncbi:glycine cleavage system protein R [Phenylobacterium immobile]|uniref:glycine cleavage system protein R n=1 Tax=Phenylobacterium immobile TaxID=21 RepID=UPI000A5938BF|nr:ACT domain-containing protein [Phenylobacterium immobile]